MKKRHAFVTCISLIVILGTLYAQVKSTDIPAWTREIHQAVADGNLDAVKKIVEAHPEAVNSTNDQGNTPLHTAALDGNMDILQYLITKGADPNQSGPGGRTALMMAALRGQAEPVRLLLEHGADPDLKDSRFGGTALYAAILTSQDGGTEVAKMLIHHGADINTPTNDGDTPVLNASRKGFTEVVSLLLEKGAEIGSRDEYYQRTLLHLAAINGYMDLAELLISRGVDVRATDIDKRTAVHYAAKYGNQSVVDLLLSKGADPREVKRANKDSHRLTDHLKDNEAIIRYLDTRGWAIKTQNHFFVFDNEESGRPPDSPSIANGYITCPEIKDFSTFALYTCYHAEPNTQEFIHGFEDRMKDITYIHYAGDQWRGNKNTVYMDGSQLEQFDGVEILSARMDENAWTLQYLIKDESVTFFYPGFLHRDLENFKKEIDYFAEHCDGVDFAFLNIPEDGNQTQNLYAEYVIEKLKPKAVFPMDPNRREPLYAEMAKQLKSQNPKLHTGCAENTGDRFFYSKGRLR